MRVSTVVVAVAGALLPAEVAPAAFSLDACSGGTVPAYRASPHNCQARCPDEATQLKSAMAYKAGGGATITSNGCYRVGVCTEAGGIHAHGAIAYATAAVNGKGPYPDGVKESDCANASLFGAGASWAEFKFHDANQGAVDEDYQVSNTATGNPGFHAMSAPADWSTDNGMTCVALEGKPEQPTYKLPMCKMYNEKSCCAPIHDAETQWAYETLVDVADRCLQYVNEEHFALREFFCIVCDAEQSRYTSMVDDMDNVPSDDNLKGALNTDVAGEIRVCKSFADRVWFHAGDDYDRCGFIIYTDAETLADGLGEQTKIIPFGDVNPASGDDPILPSKYWQFDPAKGTAIEQFFNTIKPGMLDKFQFRVVDDVNDPNLKDTCFHGSGGAFGVVPSLVLSLAVLFSMWL